MKFGVFSVSLPEYEPKEAVKLLKEIGYDGVEWRVNDTKNPTSFVPEEKRNDYEFRYWVNNKATLDVNDIEVETREIKEYCDEIGIEIFALSTYLKPEKYDELAKVYKAAQDNDIGMVRIGNVSLEPSYEKEKRSIKEILGKMKEELKALVELSKSTGVKSVIEIHMGTPLASASAAYSMLKDFDPKHIGVIVDPGNMVKEGYEEYRKVFEILGDYVAHVHIKNGKYSPKDRDELGGLEYEFEWTPLKDGQVDFKRLFEVIREVGYDKNFSVEDFSNEKNTKDKLEDNLAYLRKLKSYTNIN